MGKKMTAEEAQKVLAEEAKKRGEAFASELKALCEKYRCDLTAKLEVVVK